MVAHTLIYARGLLLGLLVAASLGVLGSPAAARTVKIVALGDSLTAGYLLPEEAAFPAVLEKALRARGLDVEIVNAGVSGDTASAGLDRLDWSVPEDADGVIVELGANDALRGTDPAVTERALDEIIARLKARNIAVLLAGMKAPRNNGSIYVEAFDTLFERLAQKHDVLLYPFFLDGIVGDKRYNLSDLLHPNPEGVRIIVERMLPVVEPFVRRLGKARSRT